jgi:hypothetical protein
VKRKACVSKVLWFVCVVLLLLAPVAGYGRDFASRSLAASSKSLRRM